MGSIEQISGNDAPTYEKIIKYAKWAIKRNHRRVKLLVTPEDMVSEAYCASPATMFDAMAAIRRIIINESRKAIAENQRHMINGASGRLDSGEKKCKDCKETKPFSMFYPRTCSASGLHYYEPRCKKCDIAQKMERRRNKPYTQHDREQARKRYLRWKAKSYQPKTRLKASKGPCPITGDVVWLPARYPSGRMNYDFHRFVVGDVMYIQCLEGDTLQGLQIKVSGSCGTYVKRHAPHKRFATRQMQGYVMVTRVK